MALGPVISVDFPYENQGSTVPCGAWRGLTWNFVVCRRRETRPVDLCRCLLIISIIAGVTYRQSYRQAINRPGSSQR